MFLFLSKLLPLLIYPLGLACVLLVVALVLIKRRPRWATGAIALALLLLLVSSNNWVSTGVMRSLEWRYQDTVDLPEAEAIVVLGGSIKPQFPPRPWIDLAEEGDRVLHGARLYLAGKAPLLVLSGGRITWSQSQSRSEAEDMAVLAEALGVPPSAMLMEPDSLNTFENAAYTQVLLADRGIERILLVTSAMHMPRALAIFKKQGFEAIPAPTDFHVAPDPQKPGQTTWQGRALSLMPQTDNLHYFTRALKEYLGIGIYWLKGWL
ncbi:YdcF family protein [Nodosilinea sp. LEGE 07298]|uniref:YdcF family protein n=1 Tax=Nodosilinea sp. LEGE 07298 TaxID=2777970 RepID=UPI00187F4E2A|nr:YdcF family protein [Nodosilinea sp. LEGE 07298]MBE9112720.1 YdcF family protein [Nodosilinea sp. LEGE 07298]